MARRQESWGIFWGREEFGQRRGLVSGSGMKLELAQGLECQAQEQAQSWEQWQNQAEDKGKGGVFGVGVAGGWGEAGKLIFRSEVKTAAEKPARQRNSPRLGCLRLVLPAHPPCEVINHLLAQGRNMPPCPWGHGSAWQRPGGTRAAAPSER